MSFSNHTCPEISVASRQNGSILLNTRVLSDNGSMISFNVVNLREIVFYLTPAQVGFISHTMH